MSAIFFEVGRKGIKQHAATASSAIGSASYVQHAEFGCRKLARNDGQVPRRRPTRLGVLSTYFRICFLPVDTAWDNVRLVGSTNRTYDCWRERESGVSACSACLTSLMSSTKTCWSSGRSTSVRYWQQQSLHPYSAVICDFSCSLFVYLCQVSTAMIQLP